MLKNGFPKYFTTQFYITPQNNEYLVHIFHYLPSTILTSKQGNIFD